MSQPLWYLRRSHGERAIGPFPVLQVKEFLRNGEVTPAWEVSLDQVDWLTILDSGQFEMDGHAPATPVEIDRQTWREQRAEARHRWLQDTAEVDRAEPHDLAMDRRVRKALLQDQAHMDSLLEKEQNRRPPVIAGLLAVLVLVGVTYFIWQGQKETSTIQAEIALMPNCGAPLAEAVNWSRCDKRSFRAPGAKARNARMERVNLEGSSLTGADFSYANLARANLRNSDLRGLMLTGADLTGADLSGSDLSQADLSFAVLKDAALEGARLDGARLGRAIWPDGHQCAEGAAGQCP